MASIYLENKITVADSNGGVLLEEYNAVPMFGKLMIAGLLGNASFGKGIHGIQLAEIPCTSDAPGLVTKQYTPEHIRATILSSSSKWTAKFFTYSIDSNKINYTISIPKGLFSDPVYKKVDEKATLIQNPANKFKFNSIALVAPIQTAQSMPGQTSNDTSVWNQGLVAFKTFSKLMKLEKSPNLTYTINWEVCFSNLDSQSVISSADSLGAQKRVGTNDTMFCQKYPELCDLGSTEIPDGINE